MNTFDAVMVVEGIHEVGDAECIEAWQHLINTGVCWNLQGWFGRTASRLIEEGVCSNPKELNESCEACECDPCDCGFGNY